MGVVVAVVAVIVWIVVLVLVVDLVQTAASANVDASTFRLSWRGERSGLIDAETIMDSDDSQHDDDG